MKWKGPFKIINVLLLVFITINSMEVRAMGEKYNKQGGALNRAITNMLQQEGFCKTNVECSRFLPKYISHGDRVRTSFYEIGDNNSKAFLSVVSLVVKDGVNITEGVPISILGFRESHEEYRRSGVFFKSVKPFFLLEISK